MHYRADHARRIRAGQEKRVTPAAWLDSRSGASQGRELERVKPTPNNWSICVREARIGRFRGLGVVAGEPATERLYRPVVPEAALPANGLRETLQILPCQAFR